MTLEEAIAEVTRVTPKTDDWWEPGDIGGGPSPIDGHICIILNAVASGELIPLSDHKLAVALAYQQAATEADARYAAGDMGNPGHHILALADQDDLAEVQALNAERDNLWAEIDHGKRLLLAAEAEIARLQVIARAAGYIGGYPVEPLTVPNFPPGAFNIAKDGTP